MTNLLIIVSALFTATGSLIAIVDLFKGLSIGLLFYGGAMAAIGIAGFLAAGAVRNVEARVARIEVELSANPDGG